MPDNKKENKDTENKDTENKKDTVSFHHYTDKESVKKIQKSGVIRQSENSGSRDDAAFGSGTYGTTMPPGKGKEAIAENNYDDSQRFPRQQMAQGKVDYAIKVEIPKNEVKREKAGGRDVLRYEGDLNLKDYPHTIHKVPDTKTNKSSK